MGWYFYSIAPGTSLALIVIVGQAARRRGLRRSLSPQAIWTARIVAAVGWLAGAVNALSLPGENLVHIAGVGTALAGSLLVLGAAWLATALVAPGFGVEGVGSVRLWRLVTAYSIELGLVCVAVAIALTRPTVQVLTAVSAIAVAALVIAYLSAALRPPERPAGIPRD